MNKIGESSVVILVLHSPREKCWGVLDDVTAAGIFIRGIDLNSFDDWMRSVVNNEVFIGPADQFFPMWRVERMTRDESSMGVPSLQEQFEQKTGRSIFDF